MYLGNAMIMKNNEKMNWLDRIVLEMEEEEEKFPEVSYDFYEVMAEVRGMIDAGKETV